MFPGPNLVVNMDDDAGDDRRMSAIVVVDIVGYSRLVEESESATLSAIQEIAETMIDPFLSRHEGRTVKRMGDGYVFEFMSVVGAVRFAVALQSGVKRVQAAVVPSRRIVFRIGINLGDVTVDGDDILGDAVNLAARLEQSAGPGGIRLSGTVYDHLAGKIDVPIDDLGEQRFKNIARPIRVYRVRLPGRTTPGISLRRLGKRSKQALAGAVIVAALAVLAIWFLPVREAKATKPSIAVLAFDNLSGDPDDVYVTEGFAEDIIAELARNREVRVLASTSSMSLRGADKTPQNAVAELGVRYVLDGSVRHRGDTLRLTVTLHEGADGEVLWSEKHDITATEIVATQDAITERIAGVMFSELRRAEKAESLRRSPNSLQVYDLAMRGLALKHKLTPEAFVDGRAVLQEAIDLDPSYAPSYAYLGLLDAIDAVGTLTGEKQSSDMGAAIALTRKAIDLDPTLAYSYQALGYALSLNGDYEAGLRALTKSVEIGPSDASNQLFWGFALASNGRFDEAVLAGEKAHYLNPLAPIYYSGIHARSLFGAGQYETALARTQPCVDRRFFQRSCWLSRIAALQILGREDDARNSAATFLAHAPGVTIAGASLAVGYGGAPEANARILDALRAAGIPEG